MSARSPGPAIYAVLTGDIIASTGMAPRDLARVRGALEQAVSAFRDSCSTPPVEAHLDIYRGDAWQVALAPCGLALRLTLYLRAELMALCDAGTRVSVGLGACEHLEPERVSLSTGEAFTLSGRALDRMTGYFDLTAALPERAREAGRWVPVSLHLASELVRAWTRRQAEIAALALLNPQATHEDIAQTLQPSVSKQSVTASLSGAGWRALQEPLTAFEETDWDELLAPDAAV